MSKPHPPFLVSWKMEDVTIKSSKIKVLFTPLKPLLRHWYVILSSRREGPIDCCDLSFFQLSFLGQRCSMSVILPCFFLDSVPKLNSSVLGQPNRVPIKFYINWHYQYDHNKIPLQIITITHLRLTKYILDCEDKCILEWCFVCVQTSEDVCESL